MCITHSSGTQLYHKTHLEDKKHRQVESLFLVKGIFNLLLAHSEDFSMLKILLKFLKCSVRYKRTLRYIYVNHSHIGSLEEIKYYILMYLNFTAGLHTGYFQVYLSPDTSRCCQASQVLCV
jgi:hypothetical protein